MASKNAREYGGSDSSMLDEAERVQLHLNGHWHLFHDRFGGTFTDQYKVDFDADVKTSRAMPSDEIMRGIQVVHTSSVEDIFNAFHPLFDIIVASAKSAFPDNEAILEEIGVYRKGEITHTGARLRRYLSDFAGIWREYSSALIAVESWSM